MPDYRLIIPAIAISLIAATSPFEDTAQLDRQVAAYLNAAIGQAGGARAPVDRKLKLRRCPGALKFSDAPSDAVVVRCPDLGWRIFVPVNRNRANDYHQPARMEEYAIKRNQPVTLVIKRPSFSIRYGVIAQKNGRIGDYIPVRSSRKSKVVMARISATNEVELAP